jgi:DNA (cytosine-5)-methyltransferase 1
METASALPRVLELHCGIGGCAAALAGRAMVTAAIDVNTVAFAVYRHNFAHPTATRAIESLRADDPLLRGADLWWTSPPCQPYTRRGKGRDLDDPRSRGLLHLLDLVEQLQPAALALENVPEMRGSQGHARLREVLDGAGYAVAERVLCPTELGVPNRRRRFYLVASRDGLAGWANELVAAADTTLPELAASRPEKAWQPPLASRPATPLAAFLDADDPPSLYVAPELLARYAHAVDVVDAADPHAVAATFTAAYGRSPVRAGSYLRRNDIVRLFSPVEILRLLGFPANYGLPPDLPRASAWRLIGNSLSIPAVREVLSALPAFGPGPLE